MKAIEIATFLGMELHGDNIDVQEPKELGDCCPGSLVWIKDKAVDKIQKINSVEGRLAICGSDSAHLVREPKIVVPKPRLSFIKALSLFQKIPAPVGIHPTVLVGDAVRLGLNVSIGAYTVVRGEVTIGDGAVIGDHVTIEGEVVIGKNCRIKHGAAIGAAGFGFEFDDDGRPIHFPHIGKIVMGDRIFIGSNTTVERATLGVTRIGNDVKIDDLVQIGHNTEVGDATLIMANVVLCGGAKIGKKCWIAPNTSVRQRISVGDGATVGLGSVVVSDVMPGQIVAGVPAKVRPAKASVSGVTMARG